MPVLLLLCMDRAVRGLAGPHTVLDHNLGEPPVASLSLCFICSMRMAEALTGSDWVTLARTCSHAVEERFDQLWDLIFPLVAVRWRLTGALRLFSVLAAHRR